MFFGKRNDLEPVEENAIVAFLDSIVQTEMRDLEKSGNEIDAKMQNLSTRFKAACNRFENISSEPHTEEIYMPNVNSIKSQKRVYAGVLNNIIDAKIVDSSISNPYERYSAMLTNIADIRNRILKTNTAFKQVIYAYSENTKEFKDIIFEMEKYETYLGNNVVKNKDRYDKYIKVRNIASKLLDISIEISKAQGEITGDKENIEKGPEDELDLRKSELLSEINAKRTEISKLRKETSETKATLTSMLMPLHKISKKFDHKSNGKMRLSDYILDPIGQIKDEASLNEMNEMLKALKKDILLGDMDVKPTSEIAASIDTILSENLLLIANTVRRIMEDEHEAVNSARRIEGELNSISIAEEQISENVNDAKRRMEYIEELTENKNKIKFELESAFEKQYGKRIKII